MNHSSVSLEQTHQFSKLFIDYVQQQPSVAGFHGMPATLDAFKAQIEAKRTSYQNREIVAAALNKQNSGIALHAKQSSNLVKLGQPNCFTVTTGHQLCLATGPLYFLYKILTTVRLAEELKETYPENEFVPVFWMATEDHDLEEINHFYLFGKKYEWAPPAKGASGKITTLGLAEVFASVPDCPVWLRECYTNSSNLSEATRKLVNHLMGEYGVIVVDGDDTSLKQLFIPQIEKDLLQSHYAPLVRDASMQLEQAGYKAQAFVRDQNFFWLNQNSRERIEKVGGTFSVLNSDKEFSTIALQSEIRAHPENFSPNVVLRPLYQELLLPNLAYIGGPGEIAYWLQLKDLFSTEEIPFPILFPRQFVTLLPKSVAEKMASVPLEASDLFLPSADFRSLLLERLGVEKFEFQEEEQLLQQLKELFQQKAAKADKSLLSSIDAEISRTAKATSEIGKKLNKALEAKNETDLNKLENIRKKLFPEGVLQERHDNFLNFFINKPDLISFLYQSIEPFDFRMHCLTL